MKVKILAPQSFWDRLGEHPEVIERFGKMENIDTLIKDLEGSEKGNDELGARVLYALNPVAYQALSHDIISQGTEVTPHVIFNQTSALNPTLSIDACKALHEQLFAGWSWRLCSSEWTVYESDNTKAVLENSDYVLNGFGKTPELSWCIAMVKAKAAIDTQKNTSGCV